MSVKPGFLALVLAAILVAATARAEDAEAEKPTPEKLEQRYLRNIRQLTFSGGKNGEAYFSADGKDIVFQGVREPGNPFYQIYRMNLADGVAKRVSPGTGRTTCAFYHPSKKRILFASTHLDPLATTHQKEEIEKQKAGPAKRYVWDFDPQFDIFEADYDGGNPVRLTDAPGYDAEGSYSPDGTKIVFCSMRDGDGEIYVMDSDGKNQTRLTTEKGYDGGPFFSPDGKKIVWRHFDDEAQKTAEIWLMDAGGGNKKQVTTLKSVTWAPWYHPSMKWIVFASNFEDPAFEIYAIRPDGSELTRLTNSTGFDGLPAVSPDGRTIMWTSNRSENRSQIFCAELLLPGETAAPLKLAPVADAKLDVYNWRQQTAAGEKAAASNSLEHYVAREFHRLSLAAPGETPKNEDDDTPYILGPSVTGRVLPPVAANAQLVVAATMQKDFDACAGVSALLESVHAAQAFRQEPQFGGAYFAVADPDEMMRVYTGARNALGQPVPMSAFVSFANLGKVHSRQLVIKGTGTSPQWRNLVEVLAARNPNVQIILQDDPAGASELKQFVDKSIPSVALTGTDKPAGFDWDENAKEYVDTQYAIGAAVDFVRLLAKGDIKIQFSAYDAAAVKAAATAAMRPYLGTIPEYKSEGVTGVKLSGVREGSPAQAANLKGGDIIVELGGKSVKDVNEYLVALEALKPGTETSIKVQRDGKIETIAITPGAR